MPSSVYIVEPQSQGWIIDRLMRDVAGELGRRGIKARLGPASGYAGEEVIFNSRYLQPFRDDRARLTSLFITHIDDRLRERELRNQLQAFDSYVCMSAHDATFVAGLKGSAKGVVGIDLPPRELSVRPARIGMFSAFYADGRKNEDWITDYFKARPGDHANSFVFCFIGADWEDFLKGLARLDVNYELYRYSRALPNEYRYQQEILPTLDQLIYLGFDGGAMSVYDALNANVDIVVTDQSYHRGLGRETRLIGDKEGFFAVLDEVHARVSARRAALADRSIERYVDRLLAHWQSLLDGTPPVDAVPVDAAAAATVAEFRQRYKPIGYSRLRSALIRFILLRVKQA